MQRCWTRVVTKETAANVHAWHQRALRWLLMRPATPRTIAILSLLLVLFAGLGGSVQAQELTSEYSIKAAFLFNFARFVEWPSEMMARSSALNLCVFGHDPFHGELERVIREKTISNRPLVGRRISAPGDARACHIVFVSAADKAKVREVLTAVRDTSCLTVGEDAEFARSGGMITFVIEDDKIRFDINLGSAEAARLKISAKVLSVARTVRVAPARD